MAKRGRPRKNPLPEEGAEGDTTPLETEVGEALGAINAPGTTVTHGFEGEKPAAITTQTSLPLDSARRPGPEPPATAVRDYDDLVRELKDLEEMTACRGWRNFYADLQSARDSAKQGLLTAEKMNDVIRAQATVHLVDTQVKRLLEPVERINEMRGRFPLFRHEFVYTGVLDEESGRVSLVLHEVEHRAPTQDAAPAAEPTEPVVGVEAGTAVAAEAAMGEAGEAECPEPATPPDDEGPAEDADDGPADEDGDDGEEGDDDDEGLTDEDEPGDVELDDLEDDDNDDPFGE